MAYLNVSEYVSRFGSYEARQFTNNDPEAQLAAGAYDAAKIEAALSDATDEVEGYISRRYTVPLASPPTIVKGWVAAIGRLKLAEVTNRVSDAIKEAADRAIRQLEQLAAGKLNLPIPEGGVAIPEVATGSPLSSLDRDPATFTGRTLAGYTDVFTGADCGPVWRQGR
jgi:phage gp36-like protein